MKQGSIFKKIQLLNLIIILNVLLGCKESNIFYELAKKDTDAALFVSAKININKQKWSEAIADFDKMSANYRLKREVAVVYASAYAGRCGLNLLDLAESLTETLPSLLFKFLMAQYKNVTTANRDDCKQAEIIIKEISDDPVQRTIDENLLIIFVSFAKIGVTLASHADRIDFNGEPDSGWDACTNDSDNFPEVSVREVGSGLAIALSSLSAIAGETDIGEDQTSTLTSICTQLEGSFSTMDFCKITDASSYTANQIKGIRSIVQANEGVGIGSCNDTLALCVCS